MKLEIHPICNLFPPMTDEEIKALSDDIKENGQREPLLVYEDKIYDGRNRFKACEMLGIEPLIKVADKEPTVRELLGLNLHRRHLTTSQRAAIAADLLPKLKVEAEKRKKATQFKNAENTGNTEFPTVVANLQQPCAEEPKRAGEEAAKLVGGTSERNVNSAAFVKTQSPELFEQVKAGKISVNSAKKKLEGKATGSKRKGKKRERAPYDGIDRAGHKVPPCLDDVFQSSADWMKLYDELRSLGRLIASQARLVGNDLIARGRDVVYCERDEKDRIIKASCPILDQVALVIEQGVPHSICPKCKGLIVLDDKEHCFYCHDRGWLVAMDWEKSDLQDELAIA